MYEAAIGMLPSDQRFESRDTTAAQRNKRLVVQGEFAKLDSTPQVCLELKPLESIGVHRAVEHLVSRASGGFRAVHRHVGAAEQLDRKSTRLNSSHSQISYAVFCLKKKNSKGTAFRSEQ